MLLIYIAIYVVILLIVWGFFAVARMHTLKFKNFSTHIVPVTNFLLVFLLVLSVLGFIIIFFLDPDPSTYEVSTSTSNSNIESSEIVDVEVKTKEDKSFQQDIIGEEFY